MLVVSRIETAKANKNDANDKLCKIVFVKETSALLGSCFVSQTYSTTAHLISLATSSDCLVKSDSGVIDEAATLQALNAKLIGTKEVGAYGFDISIATLLEDDTIISVKFGDREVTQRAIIGMGNDETTAKTNAIERERARLRFAVERNQAVIVRKSN